MSELFGVNDPIPDELDSEPEGEKVVGPKDDHRTANEDRAKPEDIDHGEGEE